MPIRSPQRLKQAVFEPPFRHHDCRFYQTCLDEACSGRWESWCCTGCPAFEPEAHAETSNNRGHDFG